MTDEEIQAGVKHITEEMDKAIRRTMDETFPRSARLRTIRGWIGKGLPVSMAKVLEVVEDLEQRLENAKNAQPVCRCSSDRRFGS